MKIGDKVTKIKGYRYPGTIVAAFEKLDGKIRYVVECTSEDCEGMLHIFNAEQLQGIEK